MKILITGVNGFIGRSIYEYLHDNTGHEIYGLGRGTNRHSIKDHYIEADISDSNQINNISKLVKKLDVIIHCAACIDKNDFNTEIIKVNCTGTQNVLKLGMETSVNKLIYISGLTVIGTPICIPINEDHPLNPSSMYHASKLMGENIALMGSKYGIEAISLRIPSPVGKGMNPNTILPIFIKKCLANEDIELMGTGGRLQNYIDIRDICSAINMFLNREVNGVFNIGSNKSYSNRELANICKNLLESSSNIRLNGEEDPEEDNKWIVSIEKSKKLLGFNPMHTIEDTIRILSEELKS